VACATVILGRQTTDPSHPPGRNRRAKGLTPFVISELDINPVKVLEHGAIVLDARIRVNRPGATLAADRVLNACDRHQPIASRAVVDSSSIA
jgi:hypothetical protein